MIRSERGVWMLKTMASPSGRPVAMCGNCDAGTLHGVFDEMWVIEPIENDPQGNKRAKPVLVPRGWLVVYRDAPDGRYKEPVVACSERCRDNLHANGWRERIGGHAAEVAAQKTMAAARERALARVLRNAHRVHITLGGTQDGDRDHCVSVIRETLNGDGGSGPFVEFEHEGHSTVRSMETTIEQDRDEKKRLRGVIVALEEERSALIARLERYQNEDTQAVRCTGVPPREEIERITREVVNGAPPVAEAASDECCPFTCEGCPSCAEDISLLLKTPPDMKPEPRTLKATWSMQCARCLVDGVPEGCVCSHLEPGHVVRHKLTDAGPWTLIERKTFDTSIVVPTVDGATRTTKAQCEMWVVQRGDGTLHAVPEGSLVRAEPVVERVSLPWWVVLLFLPVALAIPLIAKLITR
jgi:hypothetical protein